MALNRVTPHAEALSTGTGTGTVLRKLGAERERWMLGAMVGCSSTMERIFIQMRYLAKQSSCGPCERRVGYGQTPFRGNAARPHTQPKRPLCALLGIWILYRPELHCAAGRSRGGTFIYRELMR